MGVQNIDVVTSMETAVMQAVLLLSKRHTDGSPLGFLPIGLMDFGLNASLTANFVEIPDTAGTVRGIAKRIRQDIAGTVNGTVYGLKRELLRAMLYGEDVAVASGSGVTETVWAEAGKIIGLSNISVSAINSVTLTSDGVTTYDDWGTLNEDFGSIILPSSGDLITAIAAATPMSDGVKRLQVDIDYDHGAYRLTRSLKTTEEELAVRIELLNTDGGVCAVLKAHKANLQPLTNFPLITPQGEVAKYAVTLDCLSDTANHPDSPVMDYLRIEA